MPTILPSSRWVSLMRAPERAPAKPAAMSAMRSSALASRTGNCRKAISAICRSLWRSRAHNRSTRRGQPLGCASRNDSTSRRSSTASVQSVMTVASAVRSLPSSTAISPNTSPGWMIASTISLPSGEGTLMRMVPSITAIMLSPVEPIRNMVSPAG